MASSLGLFAGPEVLEDANHARGLMNELKKMYDCRLLGDVTIGVECEEEAEEKVSPEHSGGRGGEGVEVGHLFLCSRNVLAAASPYFKSMFTGGLTESAQERVLIRGVDSESMSVIIDYCYTGRVTITESNVQRLYAAANMLQLEYISRVCTDFMSRRLDPSNCVAMLKLADTYNNPELKKNAQVFIARNFTQVCNAGDLCELNSDQFKELLSLDTLDVDCEKTVCSAAVQWLEGNAAVDKEEALQVLKCVRWSLFSEEDLESLKERPLMETYLSSFFRTSSEGGCKVPAPLDVQKHRIGVSAKEMILFFGRPNEVIMCCEPYSEDLYIMSPASVPFTSQEYKSSNTAPVIACSTPDNSLYLTSHLSKQFWVYNPVLNRWQELAERLLGRIHAGMVYLNGHIYLLGGRNPVTDIRLKEVECYSIQRNQWMFVAPLPHYLGKMQVVAVNDHLYVLNKRRMLCYDPKKNHWLQCGSLRRDKLHKACIFQEQIVCVCDIPVIKAYSPTRGEWKRFGDIPMENGAVNYQVIQHRGKLLLLTHMLHRNNRDRVLIHEYDPNRDAWKNLMAVYVSAMGPVCVSTRVYPAFLRSGHRFSTEEDDDSGSSADWDPDILTDAESDSGSSSSFSDENMH
ncbi:kelch repeat and BTB domain-containing protein 7 [Cyprinodon tularosa]|uniref:kelch repeat and BTB domain-containing protein 7 n=1 Tax=Cyprinodon tularosa TaxID=77115 RepID=UPI0018E1F9EC|nr:kelch repeat and BTB domain-containing protein 7 [Cyprinodon tularosa]